MKILFLHGWHSVPGGVKPTYLKDHGHEVINPALPDEDFAEAVRIGKQTETGVLATKRWAEGLSRLNLAGDPKEHR